MVESDTCLAEPEQQRGGLHSRLLPGTLILCALLLFSCGLIYSSSATEPRHHLRRLHAIWTGKSEPAHSFAKLERAPHLPGGISKIIHQSWKSTELPEQFDQWAKTWQHNHPGWQYVLWTDDSNRQLVQEHFPHLLPLYDGFSEAIVRADMARVLYMKQFGGVYADLDFESLKGLDPLLQDLPLALARMGDGTLSDHEDAQPHSIPNAFMCSSPHHAFWDFAIEHIVEKAAHDAVVSDTNWDHVEQTAGPGMVYAAYAAYVQAMNDSVPLLPAAAIYPYDWTLTWSGSSPVVEACHGPFSTFDPQRCKEFFPDAYAITYWTHSWGEKKNV